MAFGLTLAETLFSGDPVGEHSSSRPKDLLGAWHCVNLKLKGTITLVRHCYHDSAKWYALTNDNEKAYDMTAEEAASFVKEGEARLASAERRATALLRAFSRTPYKSIEAFHEHIVVDLVLMSAFKT